MARQKLRSRLDKEACRGFLEAVRWMFYEIDANMFKDEGDEARAVLDGLEWEMLGNSYSSFHRFPSLKKEYSDVYERMEERWPTRKAS